MAAVYRFRVTAAVGTNRLGVGPKEYAAGQEFTLTTDQVKKFLDKRMFELGYLVMLEEVGEGQPQVWNDTAANTVSGKPGQIQPKFSDIMELDEFSISITPTLVANDVIDQTNEASYWVPTDCFFEALQLPTVTLTNLAAANYRIQVQKIPNGDGTAAAMLEYAGTASGKAVHAAVGASGAMPTNVTVAANGPGTSGTVDLGLAANNLEWVYVGYFDQFDGLYIDIDTAQAAACTATYQYSKVTDSGTIEWTTFASFTDGTVAADKALAQDGSVTWPRPGNWGKTLVGSEASGSAPLYYMRIGNATTGTAMTATADANEIWLLSKRLTPKDNNVFLNKGDMIRIDSPLNATGTIAGANFTGAIGMVLTFREAR